MALGASSVLKTTSVLQQLLEEINFQRTKEMRQLLKDDSGFVILQGTTYWTDLFVRHFLFQTEHQNTIDCDDLLFFVRKKHVKGTSRYLPKFETEVDVFRKDSRKLPIGDPDIDWEETVYLNLVIHQFDYTLTLAICTRTSPKELQVLKRHSQKVYASPSRRKMDTKGEGEEMTYPHICFMVDNFDEVFCDILVRDGEMVCVELVARDRDGSVQGVIFLGSIRYDALKKVYDARQSSLSTKVAQRMTFGLFSNSAAQRCEFVRMKGPQGKGHAEMAVTKPRGSGIETPTSEPGFCLTDGWDEWDENPEEFYNYRHQRRLSDPSANLNNFARGGWKTKPESVGSKCRSENEGLDSLENGMSEIEAGDLRDDHPASSDIAKVEQVTAESPAACCCWRSGNATSSCITNASSMNMSEVYCRACDEKNIDSPACLANVTPKKTRQIPAQPTLLKTESELEVPGKNGNKLTGLVNNTKTKNDDRKRRSSLIEKRKSENLEYEIADDASALSETDVDLVCKPTRLGNIDDSDPALVMVNGTEELPSVEVTSTQKNNAKVNNNPKSSTSTKNKEAKKIDQSNKNVWSRLNAQKKNNNVKTTKSPLPKREVVKTTPKPIVQKEKKSVKPIVNMMKQTNIKDGIKAPLKKSSTPRKPKDVEIKIHKKPSAMKNGEKISVAKVADNENVGEPILVKTTDNENNIIPNEGIETDPPETKVISDVDVDTSGSNDTSTPSPKDENNEIVILENLTEKPNSNGLTENEINPIVNTNLNSDTKETPPSNINEVFNNTKNHDLVDEMTRFKGNLDHTAAHITTVKVGDRTYCTLPKRKRSSVHHSMWYRESIKVPMRTTPDGTDIYYWCDISKDQDKEELDDGAHNPLWAMRGFTQTFHFWKENRRQQSTPLNAFLTYVTLPWWSIAKDILDHREGPILTF